MQMNVLSLTVRPRPSTAAWVLSPLYLSPRVAGLISSSRFSSLPLSDKPSYIRFRKVASLGQRKQLQRTTGVALAMAEVAPYPRGHKPVGEVETSKPRLWIYDHCPFCARARMILGIKEIDHDLVYMLNDDVATPTALVGKKMVPILELGRRGSDDHEVMPESLDIVRRLDQDPAYGPPVLAPASGRKDISDWIASISIAQRRLLCPRLATTPLPEFQTRSAREAYILRHPLSDPSSYDENLRNSPNLIEEMEQALWKLAPMIGSDASVNADGKLSYDDIILWPRLRALTIVRGLGIPPKIQAYLERLSERCDIPLHDKMSS